MAFPASLNVITPGKIVLSLVTFDKPMDFWIYHIPREIGFTLEGFGVVSLVFLRVLNSISVAMLIIYTTSFPLFIKSFKMIGVPDAFLMIMKFRPGNRDKGEKSLFGLHAESFGRRGS